MCTTGRAYCPPQLFHPLAVRQRLSESSGDVVRQRRQPSAALGQTQSNVGRSAQHTRTAPATRGGPRAAPGPELDTSAAVARQGGPDGNAGAGGRCWGGAIPAPALPTAGASVALRLQPAPAAAGEGAAIHPGGLRRVGRRGLWSHVRQRLSRGRLECGTEGKVGSVCKGLQVEVLGRRASGPPGASGLSGEGGFGYDAAARAPGRPLAGAVTTVSARGLGGYVSRTIAARPQGGQQYSVSPGAWTATLLLRLDPAPMFIAPGCTLRAGSPSTPLSLPPSTP